MRTVRTQICPVHLPPKKQTSGLEGAAVSAAEALKLAQATGLRIEVDGNDLLLEAPAPPPPAVLDALRQDKAEIIAMLRPERDGLIAEHRPLPSQTRGAPTRQPSMIGCKTHRKGSDLDAVADLLKGAKAAGVRFFEHVASGNLVVE